MIAVSPTAANIPMWRITEPTLTGGTVIVSGYDQQLTVITIEPDKSPPAPRYLNRHERRAKAAKERSKKR